jgi:hypothetical protein
MDRNQITGIILMVALYVGYIWYSTPSEEERNAAIAEQERLVEEVRQDSLLQIEEEAFQATLRQEEVTITPETTGEATDPKLTERFGSLASAAVGQDATSHSATRSFKSNLAAAGEHRIQHFYRNTTDTVLMIPLPSGNLTRAK